MLPATSWNPLSCAVRVAKTEWTCTGSRNSRERDRDISTHSGQGGCSEEGSRQTSIIELTLRYDIRKHLWVVGRLGSVDGWVKCAVSVDLTKSARRMGGRAKLYVVFGRQTYSWTLQATFGNLRDVVLQLPRDSTMYWATDGEDSYCSMTAHHRFVSLQARSRGSRMHDHRITRSPQNYLMGYRAQHLFSLLHHLYLGRHIP